MSGIILPLSAIPDTPVWKNVRQIKFKPGLSRLIYNYTDESLKTQDSVSYDFLLILNTELVDLADEKHEKRNVRTENIRNQTAEAIKTLKSQGFTTLSISDEFAGDKFAVTEGAILSTWDYKPSEREKYPQIIHGDPEALIRASAQNFARELTEMPANLCSPQGFVKILKSKLKQLQLKNVEVLDRDVDWIKQHRMDLFLSVSNASLETAPPVFLEVHVNKSSESPKICWVGKGVTFDAGGNTMKQHPEIRGMRMDMGGTACTVASLLAIAQLNEVKDHICGVFPLTENMVGPNGTKPADVIQARNGKTVSIEDCDAEGRLCLADAQMYVENEIKPQQIITIATLTGAVCTALGEAAFGVWSRSDSIYEILEKSGRITGDRCWRLPLFEHYLEQMQECRIADLSNWVHSNGGACTAAAFLGQFCESPDWMYLDICSVTENFHDGCKYVSSGFSGRPTRTLIEFMEMVCMADDQKLDTTI